MADKPAPGSNPIVASTNPTAADVKTLPKAKEDEGFDYVLDAMNGVLHRLRRCACFRMYRVAPAFRPKPIKRAICMV